MSRGGWDDSRDEILTERPDRMPGGNQDREPDRAPARPRSARRPDVPIDRLSLPRTDRREQVEFRDRAYHLRGSETRILATVGAFRVVPSADLRDPRSSVGAFTEDLRRLSDQGLIERRTIPINREPAHVVVLTREGKALLDSHREQRSDGTMQNGPGQRSLAQKDPRHDGWRRESRPQETRQQEYHAGLVKPRELAHDAQLYRLYQAEAGRIEDNGGRITRVVLDYELKRDYQTFLHRRDRASESSAMDDMREFAAVKKLPVIDDHLELPDLRIEYETADGRWETRDLELVTEHYSRSQISGKARAGFGLYRAAGAGRTKGGTPHDPHHLEDL